MKKLDQTNSSSSSNFVYVYQRQCAISNSQKIATGGFGPCYVLVGHDPKTKYSFMAHIDDITNIEDVHKIFAKLKNLGVHLNDLADVRLMGGWKTQAESNKWAGKIIKVLEKEGICGKVDFTYFQQKKERGEFDKLNMENADQYFYNGGILDPQTGKFQFFKNMWMKIEEKQAEFIRKLKEEVCKEIKFDEKTLPVDQRERLIEDFLADKEYPLEITVVESIPPANKESSLEGRH